MKTFNRILAVAAVFMALPMAVMAQDTTEEYDFVTASSSGETYTSALSETGVTSTSGVTVFVETATFCGLDLNGRLAFSAASSAPSSNKGLVVNAPKRRTVSILNLKKGDKVTLTHGAATLTCTSDNVGSETIESGTEYTMESDGSLDVYVTNSTAWRLSKLVIVTPKSGGTTDIETVQSSERRVNSSDVYDLSGRRVSGQMAPGIYIVAGRKQVVK